MHLGICVSNEDILKKIKTIDKYVEYFETFALSDEHIETIREYTHRIIVLHLPDLKNNCI